MRSCILIAVACILIPAATLANDTWQRTPGNMYAEPASSIQRTGPGYHVVGPTAALQRLFDGAGFHVVGPTAALLGLFGDVRYHLLGPKAALCSRPGTREGIQGSAE